MVKSRGRKASGAGNLSGEEDGRDRDDINNVGTHIGRNGSGRDEDDAPMARRTRRRNAANASAGAGGTGGVGSGSALPADLQAVVMRMTRHARRQLERVHARLRHDQRVAEVQADLMGRRAVSFANAIALAEQALQAPENQTTAVPNVDTDRIAERLTAMEARVRVLELALVLLNACVTLGPAHPPTSPDAGDAQGKTSGAGTE